MGGLYNKIPRTYKVFLIGTIAIAGIPPLAGFWSKDEIMAHAFVHGYYGLYLMAAIGAFLTSFYMFRLTYLTFYGASRVEPEVEHHIHESPQVMMVPLMILAGLAAIGGFVGFPPEHGWFHGFLASVATPTGAAPHEVSLGVLLGLGFFATIIAFTGLGLAHYLYKVIPNAADRMAKRMPGPYTTLLNKYYVDEAYDLIFVEPCKKLGMIWDWLDRHIIDEIVRRICHMTDLAAAGSTWIEKHVIYGGINVVGYANHLAAWAWRKLQSGMVHHYAAVIVVGLFLLAHFILIWLTGSSVL